MPKGVYSRLRSPWLPTPPRLIMSATVPLGEEGATLTLTLTSDDGRELHLSPEADALVRRCFALVGTKLAYITSDTEGE